MKNQLINSLRFSGYVLLAIALFASCSKKEEQAPAPEAARPVRVMTLRGAAQGVTKVYPAKTEAKDKVDAAFEVAGKIIEIPIERGMAVQKDQVLARLDARDFENDRDAKKAQLVKAQAELTRYRKLYEDDAVSLQELQIRERDVSVAEANLRTAEKAVQDTVLKAPFAGIVATKYVDNFQSIPAKTAVARIQNSDAIETIINVPERDIAMAGKNAIQKAKVRFDAFPDREFDLTLKEFEAEADPVTQTFKVKFTLPNPPDVKILPGMSASVTLVMAISGAASVSSGFVIPSAAVVADSEGRSSVWAVDLAGQTVHRRDVVLGKVTGTDSVEVSAGLNAGDMIAVSGIYHLREGMKIQPKESGTEMVR